MTFVEIIGDSLECHKTKVGDQRSKHQRSKLIFLSGFLQIVLCVETQLSKAFIMCFDFFLLVTRSYLLYLLCIEDYRAN